MNRSTFSVVALIGAGLLCVGCGGSSSSGPAKDAAPSADKDGKPKLGKADFTLTSKDFAEEFKKDKTAAHAKYKGKIVEVTGKVESVGRNASDEPILTLEGPPKSFDWTQCLTRDRYPWKTAAPGQTVTVKGKGHDFFPGAILLDCEIVEVKGDKPPALTADELAKEYAADPKAAAKKYEEKWIALSGEVEKVNANDTVDLKTQAKGPRVRANFGAAEAKQLKGVKPGQKIQVLGNFGLQGAADEVSLSTCILMDDPK
jgi:hypothetical protein